MRNTGSLSRIDPRWAFLISIAIFHVGTQISLLTRHDYSVSEYYLPTALSLVLIQWWGPKPVLPAIYLNAVLTSHLWGNPVDQWYNWFLFAIPETLFPFFSWFFFRIIYKGKYWLPDVQNLVLFLVVGALLPAVIETFVLQSLMVWIGDQSQATFWAYVASNLLSEFTTTFFLALPLLYYLTPYLHDRGLTYGSNVTVSVTNSLTKNQIIELTGIFLLLLLSCFLIEFKRYWYVYGIASLYVAIRFGFGPTIITNLYIILIAYVLPRLLDIFGKNVIGSLTDVGDVFLGADLLFVFSAITGRVFSDVGIAKEQLIKKNAALESANHDLDKINKELDRFVYSVSHDLSAPIKSIIGLINLSRLTKEPNHHFNHLNMIEDSILRLEYFISEVLDFSKNKRLELSIDRFQLQDVLDEILDNLRCTHNLDNAEIEMQLQINEMTQDKARLKIILNNLISNAVKFQKGTERPSIYINSRNFDNQVLIEVIDNGEGIKSEYQPQIFDMFFRASTNSSGAGLGLYIAKEVAKKIDGELVVESEFGKGSKFALILKGN